MIRECHRCHGFFEAGEASDWSLLCPRCVAAQKPQPVKRPPPRVKATVVKQPAYLPLLLKTLMLMLAVLGGAPLFVIASIYAATGFDHRPADWTFPLACLFIFVMGSVGFVVLNRRTT